MTDVSQRVRDAFRWRDGDDTRYADPSGWWRDGDLLRDTASALGALHSRDDVTVVAGVASRRGESA